MRQEARSFFHTFAVAVLVLWGTAGALHADGGGTLPIPELAGAIAIEADGACSDAEWPAAGGFLGFDLSNTALPVPVSGSGKMAIQHPDDPMAEQSLYLYFTINDNSSEALGALQDSLVFMFDLDNAHTPGGASFAASSVRGVRVLRDGSAERVFANIANPSDDNTPVDANRVCVTNGPTGWIVEMELHPSDIGRSDFKIFTAAAVRTVNINGGNAATSDWPTAGAGNMNNWPHLVSRAPIDYVMLIDQSGSMSGAKWDSARLAGNHLREMLVRLNDTVLANAFVDMGLLSGQGDRVGLATFSTGIGGNATTNRNLGAVAAAPADYTGVLPSSPSGATPMAAGLNQTFTTFGGAGSLGSSDLPGLDVVRKKVVVLLSDGMHNSPSTLINFNIQGVDLNYLPVVNCDNNLDHASFVHVYPVAVGSDATTDTGKLADFRDCYRGPNFYNITPHVGDDLTADLTTFFFTALMPYYQLNMLFGPGAPGGGQFEVRAGERHLVLFAFWPAGAAMKALSVTGPNMAVINGTCPGGTDYCTIELGDPESGAYTAFTAPGAVATYGLLDLQLEARFALDNEPHGTDSTITLRARLQDRGLPLTGAQVRVDIARPEEGFGTVASTRSLDGCERIEPRLPDARIGGPVTTTAASVPAQQVVFSSPNLNVQAKPQNGDVKPPAYALMEALLAACGRDGLERAEETGLQLFDDGTHGDATAGDGIYTLTFTNTTIEGSYIFRFRASGQDNDGRPFARVQQISEYVRVAVDPATSLAGSVILGTSGNTVIRQYHVTPRDLHLGYLGPGHADDVQFLVSGAQPVGGVRDFNNGIYAQVVRYDSTTGTPVVVAVVQDQPIAPPAEEDETSKFWIVVLLILVLLLLLLLIWCFFRKRRGSKVQTSQP